MRDLVVALLRERGVTLEDIGELVLAVQAAHHPGLTLAECTRCVYDVLGKREVQYTILTGVALDQLTEKGLIPQPLQAVLAKDEPLYGVDETLALGIINVYGSIGLTNFGYLDRQKVGILLRLDRGDGGAQCHTFLDDLVAGVAAAAAARLAHARADALAEPETAAVAPGEAGSRPA